MAKTLEELVDISRLKDLCRDKEYIKISGAENIYEKPLAFLGVEPFLAYYGRIFKKTYLVLPHFKEKFEVMEKTYCEDELIIKVKSNGTGKIEPKDYLIKENEGYRYPPFIGLLVKGVSVMTCSTRFVNSEYFEVPENIIRIKFLNND